MTIVYEEVTLESIFFREFYFVISLPAYRSGVLKLNKKEDYTSRRAKDPEFHEYDDDPTKMAVQVVTVLKM